MFESLKRKALIFLTAMVLTLVGVLIYMVRPDASGSTEASSSEYTYSTLPNNNRPHRWQAVSYHVSPGDPPPSGQAASAPRSWTGERLKSILETPGALSGEAILKFASAARIAALKEAGLVDILWADERLGTARIAVSDLRSLATILNSLPPDSVEVEPNYRAWLPGLPREDPGATDTENAGGREEFRDNLMAAIGADQDRGDWGRGVTVALLDSGVATHRTFNGVDLQAVDLGNGEITQGHGTAMGSLIAGNIFPAEGVAPAASILDVHVTDGSGGSNTALIAEGVIAAADQNVDVINISLGTAGNSDLLRNAIEYALDRQVIIVAAAGNEQRTSISYPAAYPGVIAVAAVDSNNVQAWFSNSGDNLTLAAPGVGIFSAYPDNKLVIGSGTSQATALTSGVVAALLSWGYTPGQISSVLRENAFHSGAPAEQVGAGILRLPDR